MSEIAKKLGMDKTPLKILVESARKEIIALCHGKRWQMCIPVQADDSDIVLSEALQAQEFEIIRLLNLIEQMGNVAEIANQNWQKKWQAAVDLRDKPMQELLEARALLDTARDELYNSGMSPALLARVNEFLWPTNCKDNQEGR